MRNPYRTAEFVTPKTPKRVWKRKRFYDDGVYVGLGMTMFLGVFYLVFTLFKTVFQNGNLVDFLPTSFGALMYFFFSVLQFFTTHERIEV